ncbi:MAG: hypothetical protein ACR2MG_17360 [Pyrinomonadaceae bacterium]
MPISWVIARATVNGWLHRYQTDGISGLETVPGGGRPLNRRP